MKIVAIHDLGELGEARGEPVIYHIGTTQRLAPLVPWLVVLGLLGLRANRRRAAWLVLLPPLALSLIFSQVIPLLPAPGEAFIFFEFILMTLALGLAAWWLLLGGEVRVGWLHRLMAALAGMALAGLAAFYGYFGTWVRELNQFSILLGICAGAMLVAVFITGWRARRTARTGTLRLALGVGFYLMLAMLLGMLGFFAVMMMIEPQVASRWQQILPQMLVMGLVFGLLLNLIVQPFMLLAGLNGFWRERARRVFGLDPLALPQPPEPVLEKYVVPH